MIIRPSPQNRLSVCPKKKMAVTSGAKASKAAPPRPHGIRATRHGHMSPGWPAEKSGLAFVVPLSAEAPQGREALSTFLAPSILPKWKALCQSFCLKGSTSRSVPVELKLRPVAESPEKPSSIYGLHTDITARNGRPRGPACHKKPSCPCMPWPYRSPCPARPERPSCLYTSLPFPSPCPACPERPS